MRQKNCQRETKSGFTLVELMVVLVIIGIMAAMIIPELHGTYQNALLRSSSRQWLDAISLANSKAISWNVEHRIRLDRRLNEYFIERRVSPTGEREDFAPIEDDASSGKLDPRILVEFRQPSQGPGEDGQEAAPANPEAVSDEDNAEAIRFYPDGTADACVIELRDQDGFRLGLRINATTARVEVKELQHL